jgi:hypothetical protein
MQIFQTCLISGQFRKMLAVNFAGSLEKYLTTLSGTAHRFLKGLQRNIQTRSI